MRNTLIYDPLKTKNSNNNTQSYTNIDNFIQLLPAAEYIHLGNKMDLFFSAMCATTKILPIKYQIIIKRKLFNIASHCEDKAHHNAP